MRASGFGSVWDLKIWRELDLQGLGWWVLGFVSLGVEVVFFGELVDCCECRDGDGGDLWSEVP